MSERSSESRREFLKQAGTVAWATPLILTLTAGRVGAQAISCQSAGAGCGAWEPNLEICLPAVGVAPCCNDCVRAGPDDMFCICT